MVMRPDRWVPPPDQTTAWRTEAAEGDRVGRCPRGRASREAERVGGKSTLAAAEPAPPQRGRQADAAGTRRYERGQQKGTAVACRHLQGRGGRRRRRRRMRVGNLRSVRSIRRV